MIETQRPVFARLTTRDLSRETRIRSHLLPGEGANRLLLAAFVALLAALLLAPLSSAAEASASRVWAPSADATSANVLLFRQQRQAADGESLADVGVYAMRGDGGARRALLPGAYFEPSTSATGRYLVVTRVAGDLGDVYGSPVPEIQPGLVAGGPGPQRDASVATNGRVVFEVNVAGTLCDEVWTVAPNGTTQRLVTGTDRRDGHCARGPSVSPDGRTVAYGESRTQRVWLMDASDGGNKRPITPTGFGFTAIRATAFAPDGGSLAFEARYQDRASQIFVVPVNGGAPSPVTDGSDLDDAHPAFSPDGGRIAFDRGRDIWVVPVPRPGEGPSPDSAVNVTSTSGIDEVHPAWSDAVSVEQAGSITITRLALRDIDRRPLSHLSVSPHSYFGGKSLVKGRITIKGQPADRLTSLRLEVLEEGTVVATGRPPKKLQKKIYVQFGSDGRIRVPKTRLLFAIGSSQFSTLDQDTNGELQLRVVAESKAAETTRNSKKLTKLVRYTKGNRYGGRDRQAGGDDWLLPEVRSWLSGLKGFRWGDMSNMNGGRFPPHATHRGGLSIDGHFNGYNKRDRRVARKMIKQVNSFGSNIEKVGVTYTKQFRRAIRGVTLADGRQATSVFRNWKGHDTHFHWQMRAP